MKILSQVSNLAGNLKLYWNKPPKGRHMSFKEIASLSFGGMGVKFIVFCVANMILSVGNTLIGNTIGIPPKALYFIYLLSVVCSFPLTALRASIIDNSHNKKGKYRPFVLYMGLPTVILSVAFTWMPYDVMTLFQKCAVVLAFNIGFQFFYNFLVDSYDSILNVLSPNTYERSDAASVKSVTDSFAPTIANLLLPLLAKAITGENTLFDMRIYRIVYPPIIILGFVLSMLIYFNTEEKIVQAKTHTVHIKFTDAFRAVAKNKYFWIISLAGWIGFLESAFKNILGWLYNYQNACSAGEYSLITTILGNASLWPMMFAPFIIRAIGKRNMLIFSNILNIFFILKIEDTNKLIWLILVCSFVNTMATMLGNTLTPSINGDIRDYQQYITGERIDGMFVAVGLIGSVVTLATSSVLPYIYEWAGLNENVAVSLGFDKSNVYDVLYDTYYFKRICSILVGASAVGACLNVIPYFFYDLSEQKQKAMVTVLKIRAMFEDYGNDALSDEQMIEAIDIIEESSVLVNEQSVKLSKSEIKEARKSHDKAAVKQAKTAYKENKLKNSKIETAKYVINEINKFRTPEAQHEVERALRTVSAGAEALSEVEPNLLKEAKALPQKTNEEKSLRSSEIEFARSRIRSSKIIRKYYPDGLTVFDTSVFDKLFSEEDEIDSALTKTYEDFYSAKASKDSENAKACRTEIRRLKTKTSALKKEIKSAVNQNSVYCRAAKPYLDSQKLLKQRNNYMHYEDIKKRYLIVKT